MGARRDAEIGGSLAGDARDGEARARRLTTAAERGGGGYGASIARCSRSGHPLVVYSLQLDW